MIVPPPNVTGALHIGHALTFTLQDAQVRWRRMCGERVEWIPGTDHAGIGTQSVVERWLLRTKGLSRHDLGREAFLGQVQQWRAEHGDQIDSQLRRLGASLDWPRRFFTLDAPRSEAVVEAFIRLHEMGLIYRTTRMVHWCPALETVISDMEIDYKEVEGATPLTLPGQTEPVMVGILHQIAYPLVDEGLCTGEGATELIVSTTRPETLLGDKALAVHPEDARYKVGSFFRP
jgi:valyl-tRNA synthetase